MKYKRAALVVVICSVSAASLYFAFKRHVYVAGCITRTWVSPGDVFSVRLLANTRCGEYVFQSDPTGSGRWNEVFRFQHEARPQIPQEEVRFLSENMGYIFIGRMYAVTTDGGRGWSVWDPKAEMTEGSINIDRAIQEVRLGLDGRGWMRIGPQSESEQQQLVTRDYGKSWAVMRPPIAIRSSRLSAEPHLTNR
jgi:hypothetical protein